MTRTDRPTATRADSHTTSQNLPSMLSNLRASLRDGCDPGDIGRTLSADIRAGRITRRQANALAVLVWGPDSRHPADRDPIAWGPDSARIRRQYRNADRVVFGE